jgi:hypothetical protein
LPPDALRGMFCESDPVITKEKSVLRPHERQLTVRELVLPLAFVLLGIVVIVPSIPGQGNSGLIAFGLATVFVGVGIARSRKKRLNGNHSE